MRIGLINQVAPWPTNLHTTYRKGCTMENVREIIGKAMFPGGILVLWFLLAYTGKLNRHTFPRRER